MDGTKEVASSSQELSHWTTADSTTVSTTLGHVKAPETHGNTKFQEGAAVVSTEAADNVGESENNMEIQIETGSSAEIEHQTSIKQDGKDETKEITVIKPIHSSIVHQISSAQVVVTLSTAVKELVENALDAGATWVEIKLSNYGAKCIEVADNGSGVDEIDLEGLALKHHTSKISEFEDLSSVETFGFRGEALSSLSSMSDLTVITKSRSSRFAWKVEYDKRGHLKSKSIHPRSLGTTVILKNIFSNLPVRYKLFIKNLKKEFNKMMNVIQAYCVIATGVRFWINNQPEKGPSSLLLSINSLTTMKERILSVFGHKQTESLLEFVQEEILDEEILASFNLTSSTFVHGKYLIEGFVSNPSDGRTVTDRQFTFVNSRPCDYPKFLSIVNDVYHQFSSRRQHCPFVCLNIKSRQQNVDVNVTPDKRRLFLQSENSLFVILKASLQSMFTSSSSKLEYQSIRERTLDQHIKIESPATPLPSRSTEFCLGSSQKFADQFSRSDRGGSKSEPSNSNSAQTLKRKENSSLSSAPANTNKQFSFFKRPKTEALTSDPILPESTVDPSSPDGKEAVSTDPESTTKPLSDQNSDGDDDVAVVYCDELEEEVKPVRRSVFVNAELLKDVLHREFYTSERSRNSEAVSKNYRQTFRARIDPEYSETAENELKTYFKKEMFKDMEIIGQFNKGFILATHFNNMFIIDQHASDEKYNFENLQKNTVLQTQTLLHPLDLDLSVTSENIIIENLELFRRNGFHFLINPQEEPSKRVKLTTIPYSKSELFGKSDIEEMIFMLEEDGAGIECRPSKLRSMLASRACRMSTMIGDDLSRNDMRKIVDHMGDMHQPWNCPHGRPTMRHLLNINLLPHFEMTFNH